MRTAAPLAALLALSCTLERQAPMLHKEKGYIVPPGTVLVLDLGSDVACDVAIDHDAPGKIVPHSPPSWRDAPPYRKAACSVRGRIVIENEDWVFHEVSVRVEPAPSPLCPTRPRTTVDPIARVSR